MEIHYNQTVKRQGKKRILKAAREKKSVIYKEIPIRLLADFSTETASQREWQDSFKAMKGKT